MLGSFSFIFGFSWHIVGSLLRPVGQTAVAHSYPRLRGCVMLFWGAPRLLHFPTPLGLLGPLSTSFGVFVVVCVGPFDTASDPILVYRHHHCDPHARTETIVYSNLHFIRLLVYLFWVCRRLLSHRCIK